MVRYRKDVGDWGEDIACAFLRKKGFEIVERNFFTPAGEIDIVAKHSGDYYFVEVKTRRESALATDLAIHPVKKWRLEILLGGLVWLIYFLHVVPGGGHNPNRYIDLTHSMVNQRVLNIDQYHENTVDKAYKDGHYYSVGLPGPSLLAIPSYLLFKSTVTLLPVKWLEDISTIQSLKQGTAGFYQQDTTAFFLSGIWLTWFVLSLVSALSTVVLYRFLHLATGCTNRTAFMTALVYAFGTPVFFYSTTYFSHVFTASLVVVCLYLMMKLEIYFNFWTLFWLGLFCGSTSLFETQGFLIIVLIGFYCLVRWGLRIIPLFSLGIILPILLHLIYNTAAFGHPLSFAYQYMVGENYDQYLTKGLLGFSPPRFDRIIGLTISLERGLWIYSPVLLLIFPGIYFLFKEKRFLPFFSFCLVAFTTILFLIASYEGWDGAAAFGPRQIILAIPFLTIFLASGLEHVPGFISVPVVFLSIANNWLGAVFGASTDVIQHWKTLSSKGFSLPAVQVILVHSKSRNLFYQFLWQWKWLVNLAYFLLIAGILLVFGRMTQMLNDDS